MRTSSLALSVFLLGGSAPALALDASARAPQPPAVSFGSVKDAIRSGVRDYNAGNKLGAARALEYAATRGDVLALWKLGHMYAKGDGVPHDDLKAFEYFSKIADEYADETPDSPNAGVVASAFVALGSYFLEGIAGSYVKANLARAHEMFHYAAAYYGDANAQYNLARMYLDGTGVEKDPRQAARWFNLAAEKGNYHAQAALGHLLVSGQGVPRQRALGLMWLTLARDAADPAKDDWVSKLYDSAFSNAAETERQTALAYLEQYLRRKR
ncbi:MAG TPA: tetratricopeptide repeat protein [Beijerinckiaceae bacterium]|nr:tetratricopeptide repeat protein [Beijerinckiaceae bacterium]